MMDNNRKLKDERGRFEKEQSRNAQKQEELEHDLQRLQLEL